MSKRAWTATLGVLGALALGGCEGPNLFTGPVAGDDGEEPARPEVLAVAVPEFVRPGGILEIRVEATAPEGVTDVDIQLSGAVVRQRTLVIDPPEVNLDVTTEFVVPATTPAGGTILVTVSVTDQAGEVSDPVALPVPVRRSEG